MKKIAILATYVGKVNRGAETFVIELTKELKKNYEVEVFSLGYDENIRENIIKINIEETLLFKCIQWLYKKSIIYRYLANLTYYLIPDVIFQKKFTKYVFKEYIELNHYDLIYPNNGVWGAKYASKYRKKNGTPFIYTGHGGIGKGENIILRTKPNSYVCLSNKQYIWAKKHNNKNNITIIHNGVKVNNFKAKLNLETNTNKEKIIISVGALTSFKRHCLTIKAVAMLENVRLIILGNGELEKKLKKLAQKELGDYCVIKYVPYKNVKEYYQRSDLFVLPSNNEPFGIVYLEAMASNLPIVAPDDDVRKEIIGDCGFFCNVENESEYASTILKALNTNWGVKPRKRAEKYDWDIIALQYKLEIDGIIEK